jgi:hypothetical protein
LEHGADILSFGFCGRRFLRGNGGFFVMEASLQWPKNAERRKSKKR